MIRVAAGALVGASAISVDGDSCTAPTCAVMKLTSTKTDCTNGCAFTKGATATDVPKCVFGETCPTPDAAKTSAENKAACAKTTGCAFKSAADQKYPAAKSEQTFLYTTRIVPSGITAAQALALRKQVLPWLTSFDKAAAFKTAMVTAMTDEINTQHCCAKAETKPAAPTCKAPTCETMSVGSTKAACKTAGCEFTAATDDKTAPTCAFKATCDPKATVADKCAKNCVFTDQASTDKKKCSAVSGCVYTPYVAPKAPAAATCKPPTCAVMKLTSTKTDCTNGCTFTKGATATDVPKCVFGATCDGADATACTKSNANCVFTAAQDKVEEQNAQCQKPSTQACPANPADQKACEVAGSGCKFTAASTDGKTAAKCARATPDDPALLCSNNVAPISQLTNAADPAIYGFNPAALMIKLENQYNRIKAAGEYGGPKITAYTTAKGKITTANNAYITQAKTILDPTSAAGGKASGASCKAPTCAVMKLTSTQTDCTNGCAFTKGATATDVPKCVFGATCDPTAADAAACTKSNANCVFKAAAAGLLELNTDSSALVDSELGAAPVNWVPLMPSFQASFGSKFTSQMIAVLNNAASFTKTLAVAIAASLKAALGWDWLTADMVEFQLMAAPDDDSTNWGLRLGVGLGVGLGVPALAAVAVGASMSGGHGGGGGHGTGHGHTTSTTTTAGTMKNRRFLANAKHVSKAVVKGTTQAKKIVSGVAKHVAGGR